MFDGRDLDVLLPIEYSYLPLKKCGTPYKNVARKTISVAMPYCPFCGEKQGA